jgi:plasmid stabilization system protein ParE
MRVIWSPSALREIARIYDYLGQGHFDDLAGVARALGRAVSEGRAEAVRSQARATHPRQQF